MPSFIPRGVRFQTYVVYLMSVIDLPYLFLIKVPFCKNYRILHIFWKYFCKNRLRPTSFSSEHVNIPVGLPPTIDHCSASICVRPKKVCQKSKINEFHTFPEFFLKENRLRATSFSFEPLNIPVGLPPTIGHCSRSIWGCLKKAAKNRPQSYKMNCAWQPLLCILKIENMIFGSEIYPRYHETCLYGNYCYSFPVE